MTFGGLPIAVDAAVPREVFYLGLGPTRPAFLVDRDAGDENDATLKELEAMIRRYEAARAELIEKRGQRDLADVFAPPPFLARAVLRDLALS